MTNKERYLAFQNKLTHLLYKNLIYKRNKAFKLFTEKNINETGIIYDDYVFNNLAEDYDFFLTGSDQVWHPFVGPCIFIFAPKQKGLYASSLGLQSCGKLY